ncbi:MAG: hypothetical protein AAF570_14865, partial [Bacteroidota bacterium]
DFWENGIKWLGVDGIHDVKTRAKLIHAWCECCENSATIESMLPGISFPTSRKKIETGEISFLDWHWEHLRRKNDRRFGRLIDLFATNSRTRRLMSYFHLRDFGLSRNIGEVNGLLCRDLPCIRITDDWRYEVRVPAMKIVGREFDDAKPRYVGTAEEAFEAVLCLLPENVGTARYFRCDGCPPPPAA